MEKTIYFLLISLKLLTEVDSVSEFVNGFDVWPSGDILYFNCMSSMGYSF